MSGKVRVLSRREWLKGVGSASLGSMFLSTESMGALLASGSKDQDGARRVPTRPFGKTGEQVSILSLGGMFDIPSNQLLLKQALNWGVTHWDTADCYEGGRSEEGIGTFFSRSPESRQRVFLVTKSDARDPEGMTRLLNQSLERLKTDYVDLYFVHGIKDISEVNEETRKWAEKAKADGRIRFFGFSTHKNMEKCMQGAVELGWIDGIMISYNFRLMHEDKMKAAVDACADAGIGLTAMKTQAGGSVPPRAESKTELALAGRFLEKGFTDKQAKLLAVWDNPAISNICSQMPNLTILKSNVEAAIKQVPLSAEEKRLLQEMAAETRSDYCAGCSYLCESPIHEAVPIGDMMRHLMYYNSYGDRDRARRFFSRLPGETIQRLSSIDFSVAERRCPQGIEIGRLLREAAGLFG